MAFTPVLAFDTSAAHCAACFLGAPIIDRHEEMSKGQAERLMPMLEEVLSEAGADWRDLAAIGVGTGPGNFTGLRIAVSAARGLALALGIPAVGVSAFEVLHAGHGVSGRLMLSLPGPRGQAYVQTFVNFVPLGAPAMLTPDEAREELRQPNLVVGGWQAERIARAFDAPHVADIWDTRRSEMTARTVANLAHAKLDGQIPWDGERPAPLYVRPADAAPPREAPPVILT